ncbi:TAXI family TRAP transporter solute-binding subunit [Streptomyces roseoverticillatus]|uniref:TAXI family TRAP transporter solute-binding subunit n=1 Tax=Streptomyces roseoverticillatus TaxID=66429 RepID=UPI001F26E5E3|nr:TAXI family TRAP transporter solute-binding subunit [Streptomyces roseoverticillatus]MCF3105301.1 TAXI family TRAP transporter solute-binding subunit [Streptomyces roseoverticillatus]
MLPRSLRPRGRRAARTAALGTVVLALLVWWLASVHGDTSPAGRMTFATGVPTGVYAKYGDLLKEDLAQEMPSLDVRLRRSQGSIDNLRQLTSGEADFTLATADSVATYRDEGKPGAGSLRACARLYDDYIQLVVEKGSPVQSARDLRGLRVGVGTDDSGVQLITRRLLKAAGLDFDKDITPVRVGIDKMPGLLERGQLDAFFWSGGLPTNAVQTLGLRLSIRLVQLGDLIEPLHAQGPQTRYYRAAVMPVDAYPELRASQAVKTLAVANLLVTLDDANPELAESVTRSVMNSRDRIGKQVHAAQKVDLRTAIFTDPLQLHAGARRYYASVKP